MQANKLDIALSKYLSQPPTPVQDGIGDSGGVTYNTYPVMKCPQCRSDIVIKTRPNNGGYYLGCMGFPACKAAMWFPGNVVEVQAHNETCRNVSFFHFVYMYLSDTFMEVTYKQ